MAKQRVFENQGNVQEISGSQMLTMGWPVIPMSSSAKVMFWAGRPGSGKSTLMQEAARQFEARGYTVKMFDDYTFLHRQAYIQTHSGRAAMGTAPIHLTEQGGREGFVVKDFAVLGQVLAMINSYIIPYLAQPNVILMVEFARASYLPEHVWRWFSSEVLRCACYVFCHAGLDTCPERVEQRQSHIVPENIMTGYYADDGLLSLYKSCPGERIEVVRTNHTMSRSKEQVARFCNHIVARSAFKTQEIILPEAYRECVFVNRLAD